MVASWLPDSYQYIPVCLLFLSFFISPRQDKRPWWDLNKILTRTLNSCHSSQATCACELLVSLAISFVWRSIDSGIKPAFKKKMWAWKLSKLLEPQNFWIWSEGSLEYIVRKLIWAMTLHWFWLLESVYYSGSSSDKDERLYIVHACCIRIPVQFFLPCFQDLQL